MTVEATAPKHDSATVRTDEIPKKKGYVVERARFPLVLKLFGLTALLIVLVVGVAVGITIQRANKIATETVNASIEGAGKLFQELQKQRLGRLALPLELLGGDSNFVAYVDAGLGDGEPAAPAVITPGGVAPTTTPSTTPATADPNGAAAQSAGVDLPSLLDQLVQRKDAMGVDLMLLLDDQGRLLARTDRPNVAVPAYDDVYDASPLVRKVVDDVRVPSASGVMSFEGKLYHAVVAPVGVNVHIAHLVSAVAIDEAFANRIAESTNAVVMFVPSAGGPLTRSRNAPAFGMQQMTGVDQILKSGRAMEASSQKIDGNSYVLTGQPLVSVGTPVGAAVFLRSRDRELAPFMQIRTALLAGGGIALLLAFILSWIIAKRLTRPIEQLAGMAQAVTAGDYSVQPAMDRSDEVGILGRSFAKMINSLRDKAELEDLYNDMAARSDERELTQRRNEPAKLDYGTVLVTDLRGLPATVGEGDATNVISVVARAMKLQEGEVQRQDGEVREIIGHRLASVFRGDRGIIHAIRAARAINEELASLSPPMTMGAGIATGEFVTGSVDLQNESGLAIVGDAPLLAMLFAWHAPTGFAFISYETAQAAGGEVLNAATREEVRLKWLQQALPVAALPLASATTSLMRAIGSSTSTMATVRMDSTSGAITAPASLDLEVGHLFAARYRIEQILGRGGMGVVYRATDTQLDEVVAIKTLPGDVMQRSPEDLERFKREIRLARRITHRNVLRTYDYGEAEGVYFISMEFVRGYTLSELLDEAPNRQMAPRVAVGIARQICRGLHAAHEQGIIHRDIKPQNVLIDAKGEVKLMDFGIARMTEAADAMTQAGLIIGTPHYMSPEQVQGKSLDARSDVYSMGILLYEMLVGRRTFESTSLTGVLTAHITEKPIPPIEIRPEIGRELNAIVLRCLSKETKERYADSGQMLAELDKVQIKTTTIGAG